MRYSQLFGKTTKTIASDADSVNAKLLTQGGFISKQMAGVYNYLPLGLRVLKKIQQIIREEMDAIGGNEIFMPVLSQEESWEKTGRSAMDVLFHLQGHGEKKYVLNPTHEEVITPLAQKYTFSYRDLPLYLYQIQEKFRDEPRAKSGLLRGKEFNMKDLYSFHVCEEDLNAYYERVKEAYVKIFKRLGIGDKTVLVYASGGTFSKYSHEFQTICETGEDTIFYVKSEDRYYNKEIAESKAPPVLYEDKEIMPMEEMFGENIIGVEDLAKYLKIPVEKTTKTLLYETDTGEIIAAAVRGGYDVNEIKLIEVLGCKSIQLASPEIVKKVTKAEVGYAGLLNLPKEVRIIMDESTRGRINFEMGANRTNYHTINVNFGRDLPEPEQFYDIKVAKEGDFYPKTNEKYEVKTASEVGNIFKLRTKFSNAFNFTYQDQTGKNRMVEMGCYGIGPSRIMGAIVEVSHDEKGIIWPSSIAPYSVQLISIGKDEEVVKKAEELYKKLCDKNVEVLYDDRDSSPGEKLADADLIGIPLRLIISKKTLEKNGVEMKKRNEKESKVVLEEEVMQIV